METQTAPNGVSLPHAYDIRTSDLFFSLSPLDRVFIGILAVLSVLIVGFFLRLYAFTPPPPFHFSENRYFAMNPAVCPNDVLRWTDHRIVTRRNVLVTIEVSVWDVEREITAIPGTPEEARSYVWTEPEVITNLQRYVVPETLPPGQYERRVASNHSRGTEVYSVPFTVREDCNEQE